jgi:hypothetical protein
MFYKTDDSQTVVFPVTVALFLLLVSMIITLSAISILIAIGL